jgi:hypothetical protein
LHYLQMKFLIYSLIDTKSRYLYLISIMDDILITKTNTDSVVFSIISQFKQRADFGMKKYGTNLDRTDLSVLEWIQHAQEEHMDAILYLEKLK